MENLAQLLNEFDQQEYLETLIILAKADKKITVEERSFIEAQAILLNVDITPYWETLGDDLSVLDPSRTSRVTKMIILRDSIALGYIDGNYDQSEKELVLEVAKRLLLTETDIEVMENWLKEYWAVIEKGKKLIGIGSSRRAE